MIALFNVGRALMVIWIIYGLLLIFAPGLLQQSPNPIGGAIQVAIAFGLGYLMDRGLSAVHRRRAAQENTDLPAEPKAGAQEIDRGEPDTDPSGNADDGLLPITPYVELHDTQFRQEDRVTKRCPFCGEEILAVAIKCKNCGSNLTVTTAQVPPQAANVQSALHKRLSALRSIGVLGVAGLLLYGLNHCSLPFSGDSASVVSSVSTNDQDSIAVPDPDGPTQMQFCALVQGFRKKYEDAQSRGANEAELSELRHDRKDAFASIINEGVVTDWTGVLDRLSTNSEGEATLNVHLSCTGDTHKSDPVAAAIRDLVDKHITLWNWTNLPRGTPLYSTLMKLKDGNAVVFSGKFSIDGAKHGNDFVRVIKMTERGSMTDPKFEFSYTALAPIPDHHAASPRTTSPVVTHREVEDLAEETATDSPTDSVKPSFDCSKTRSPPELLICSDAELAGLDNDYASLYKKVLAITSDKALFLKNSRDELRRREHSCVDKACLVSWYTDRRIGLQSFINPPTPAPEAKPEPEVGGGCMKLPHDMLASVVTIEMFAEEHRMTKADLLRFFRESEEKTISTMWALNDCGSPSEAIALDAMFKIQFFAATGRKYEE